MTEKKFLFLFFKLCLSFNIIDIFISFPTVIDTLTPQSRMLRSQSVFESEAVRRQREREQERDTRYTKASILLVILFLMCHGPRFATNTMELLLFDPTEIQPEVRAIVILSLHELAVLAAWSLSAGGFRFDPTCESH